jgi:polyhydroxyalkanoate synthase subunit PhaC
MTRPDLDLAAPIDAVLIDAAFGPVRQLAPDMSAAKLADRVAARPGPTAARLRSLAAGLSRAGLGTSEIAPEERDRRFAEPAWAANPLLRGSCRPTSPPAVPPRT